MRILFVTTSSINGGAQKHIRDTFISLCQRGEEVYLIAPKGWLTDELADYESQLYKICPSLKTQKQLVKIIRKIMPDVVNTFILSAGVMGTLAWRRVRCGKLFVTVNNQVIYEGISHVARITYPMFYRWMAKYVCAFLVKSDSVSDEVRRIVYDRVPVVSIKNGVDFQRFNRNAEFSDLRAEFGARPDEIIVTNVAALEKHKGQRYLLEAVAQLKDYPVRLVLVGDGSDAEELYRFADSLGILGKVSFLGRREDINNILANSDIFVLSSLHEGLPNALMEAMAMRLPCISTDVGGIRQLVTDDKKGILVKPKSATQIKNALCLLFNKPEMAKEIGEHAYIYIYQNFRQECVIDELMKVYSDY